MVNGDFFAERILGEVYSAPEQAKRLRSQLQRLRWSSNLQSFCDSVVLQLRVCTLPYPGNIFNSLRDLRCLPVVSCKVLEKTYVKATLFLGVGVISLLLVNLCHLHCCCYVGQG